MSAIHEQPARLPSTPEEMDTYLRRREERLWVEHEAHERMDRELSRMRRERLDEGRREGVDILDRLIREHRAATERLAAELERLRTTRARD